MLDGSKHTMLVAILAAVILRAFGSVGAETSFYVATGGSDSNPGTVGRPFGTISRARDAVREKIKAGLNEPVTILVRGGRHQLNETLVFGPEDSGNTECCIVEYNHIHDVMTKIADGGGIYTLGYQPETVLRGNRIYNVYRSSYAHGGAPNNGIFFDEGSKGFLVEDNVIYNTSGDSIRFNQNKKEWHTWRNNSFGIKPDEDNFPKATASRAGLQEPYRKAAPE